MALEAVPKVRRLLYCSFCGKGQDEVFKLVSGPEVKICDECVAAAQEIIAAAKIAMGCTAVLQKTTRQTDTGVVT